MHKKKLQAFALILAASLCLQPIISSVNECKVQAATYYLPGALTETYVSRAEEYLSELETDFNIAASGQSGLLSKLDDIQRFSMVLYYLDYYRDYLNLAGVEDENSEITFYRDKLAGYCQAFNTAYGSDSTSYIPLNLNFKVEDCDTDKKLRKAIKDLCKTQIPTYLGTVLNKVNMSAQSQDPLKTKQTSGVLLSNVCLVIDNMEEMLDDLTSISPYKSSDDLTQTVSLNGKMKLREAYSDIRTNYATLLDIGESVLQAVGASSVITINEDLGYVANMANVTESNGNVVIPEGVQLSQAYLAILSAGATYVPFDSYVGESSFVAALKSLVSDQEVAPSLVSFYDDTKSFRKPLYRRSLSNEGIPTGKAELITVSEFLDDIKSGAEAALVTVAGKFVYDSDNNYWVYADTYSTNQDTEELTNATTEDQYIENADDEITSDEITPDEAEQIIEDAENEGVANNEAVSRTVSDVADAKLTVKYYISTYEVTYKFQSGGSHCEIILHDILNNAQEVTSGDFTCGTNKPGETIAAKESELGVPEKLRFTKDPDTAEFCKAKVSGTTGLASLYYTLKSCFSPDQDLSQTSNGGALVVYAASTGGGGGTSLDGPSDSGDGTNSDLVDIVPDDTGNTGDTGDTGDAGDTDDPEESDDEETIVNGDESGDSGDGSSTTVITDETIKTTIDTSQLSGMSVTSKDVAGLMADKTITSEDRMSEPIMLYGAKHSRAVDNLTTILLRNIIKGTVGCESMYPESNDYLYVNAYGDILTDDGMVILPGIANPILYNSSSAYNPYTAAFMNYYPTVLENTNFFQVASKEDIGKTLILNQTAEMLEDGTIDPESLVTNKANKITSKCDIKSTAPLSVPEFELGFTYNDVECQQLLGYTRLIFGDSNLWSKDGTGMYAYTPLLIKMQLSSGGVPIFPYSSVDDRNTKTADGTSNVNAFSCAEMIAKNMFHFLTTDSSGQVTNLGKLNDNYIVYYFCVSNLNGTSNPLAYANEGTYAYDRYVNDTESRGENTLLTFSEKLVDSLGYIDQIIGIKTSAQDGILGPAFAFVKKHWLMSFMLLLVILLFAFARTRKDGFQTIVLLGACTLFAYLFVYIFPTYLPLAYNALINNVSETLAYKILAVKVETNDLNQTDTVALDEDGNYAFNTSSLNLYRVGLKDLTSLYNGLGIEESDVVGGSSCIVNQEAGLFVEGDTIKINTDVLFDTLKITGSIDSSTGNYYLKSIKTVSNNMDYYTPYYSFVELYIDKLNDLTTVYSIPRSVTKYSDDVIKDNYLVYSYTNSMPFLTPGNYDSFDPEDLSITSAEELLYIQEREQELTDTLTATFGDENTAADWLGISDFFYSLDYDFQQTLWAQTMYDCGYYYYDEETETDWVPNEDKINKLCNYINSQTKHFVFAMEDQIGAMSDDTMIKIITLRELTAFTQYVSDMGHWLYPFSVNYQEMSMLDVLNCVLVDDYYYFISTDMNICAYILSKYGWLHLIMFDALVVFLFIVCTVVHFAVPLMYLLLGILLLLKMLTDSDIKVPIKGYLKCTIITMLCSTVLCAGIVLTNKFNSSVICIYFMIAVVILVATVLLTIMTSLITNIADFGNTAMNAKLEGIQNTFNKYSAKSATTNIITNGTNKVKGAAQDAKNQMSDLVSRYSTSRSVDDFYDDMESGIDMSEYSYDADDDFDRMYEPEVFYEDSQE